MLNSLTTSKLPSANGSASPEPRSSDGVIVARGHAFLHKRGHRFDSADQCGRKRHCKVLQASSSCGTHVQEAVHVNHTKHRKNEFSGHRVIRAFLRVHTFVFGRSSRVIAALHLNRGLV